MIVLSFDTCLNKTYLQLQNSDGNILASKIIENKDEKYHSAFLMPTLAEILNENKLEIKDISLIAVNVGPGSFTGIRACLVIARTLAQQWNIDVIGFPSLQILSCMNKSEKNSLVLMDARKNKAYVGIYDKSNNPLTEEKTVYIEEIEDLIKNDDYFVITDKKMYDILNEKNILSINYENYNCNLAEYITNLALKNLDKKENWTQLKPLYIQPPPVTMKK